MRLPRAVKSLLVFAVLALGVGLAGCDDHVTVDRDPSIPIIKGNTWAWRPMEGAPPPGNTNSPDRPVISRDIVPGRNAVPPNPDIENDIVRNRIKYAIERSLAEKGLVQVQNPAQADFLVDYHIGVQNRRETVATPVNRPVLVCGYYGCWNSYGWGYWGPPELMYHTVRYREGTIVLDLVQRAGNRLAYRAIGQKAVNQNAYSQDSINSGVKALLKQLKPSK